MIRKSVLSNLHEIALEQAPHEAAGIIVNEMIVVGLPNRSATPHKNFELNKEDIRAAIADMTVESIAVWHSHPSGGVGPSRFDIEHKVQDIPHLVVTLQGQEIIPTWY